MSLDEDNVVLYDDVEKTQVIRIQKFSKMSQNIFY